eukprot:6120697-Ditylum_brightwellii.AAC.1
MDLFLSPKKITEKSSNRPACDEDDQKTLIYCPPTAKLVMHPYNPTQRHIKLAKKSKPANFQ